jgi:hypothetical protein
MDKRQLWERGIKEWSVESGREESWIGGDSGKDE